MKVENFKRFSLKMLRCIARAFPVGTAYDFFTPRKTCMRMNLNHMASGRFVLRAFIASSIRDNILGVRTRNILSLVRLLATGNT